MVFYIDANDGAKKNGKSLCEMGKDVGRSLPSLSISRTISSSPVALRPSIYLSISAFFFLYFHLRLPPLSLSLSLLFRRLVIFPVFRVICMRLF